MMTPAFGRAWGRFGAVVALAVVLLFGANGLTACAKKAAHPSTSETIAVHRLPPEAQKTLALIHQDGPFPNRRDGIIFGNREKQLPRKPRGYYHEYTVPTPGARDRGARRIVCGGEKPSAPDHCYYTADHYQSFQLIRNETAQP
ncbi:MAG: ribonuclease N1 [Betaproteobacteria bacterium]|nr:ribonuclease N1 [Betaproteobacteria bacterium]